MRICVRQHLAILFCILLSLAPALSQERRPLSVADIEALLKARVSANRVAELIEERGVNFSNNSAVSERLQKAGANARVLVAASKAAEKYASSTAKERRPEPTKQNPVESKKPTESKTAPLLPASKTGKDAAEMVLVPAGEFWLGSEDSDAAADEKPRRRVHLDAYRIEKYEVNHLLYGRFMEITRRAAPRFWNDSKWNSANQPVVGVDWNDALAYCHWVGKRLPTEAEWEKAASGTDGRKYPWGKQWDASRANSEESGLKRTTPVGSYSSGVSSFGVHDMAGNVWEWVADWYDANYYQSAPTRNSKGPDTGQYRVLRGGAWNSIVGALRTSNRRRSEPTVRNATYGFRCAQ